ncbi:MAG TPA: Rieske (2Fe-2S) protein [Byssovorax sp.]|jgi:Rieske Fe-S protein
MTNTTDRRRFLQVMATGTAATACAALGVSCGASGPSGPIAAGNVSSVANPSLTAISGEEVALGRDDGGLYAMTLVCTHASCDMETQGSVSVSGVTCSCHGSRFDANGDVLVGPANAPLEHFEVTVDASGAITINADSVVDASTRTQVTTG